MSKPGRQFRTSTRQKTEIGAIKWQEKVQSKVVQNPGYLWSAWISTTLIIQESALACASTCRFNSVTNLGGSFKRAASMAR